MANPKTDLPPIRACLFDMDGLLIDSEDIYTTCANTILRSYGKPDLPWSIKAQLQGRPASAAGLIFQKWAQLPISYPEFLRQQAAIQRELFPNTKPLPGVLRLLATLDKSRTHLALATSSHAGNFKLKSAHLPHLFAHFPPRQRVLGDDPRIPPGKGKPAPDIYLLALETVNEKIRAEGKERAIAPEECLVFEDSVPGVEAGRRAGMQVVWCPHPELLTEYKGRERAVLAGLTGDGVDAEEEAVKVAEEANVHGGKVEQGGWVKGTPGTLDDGWATLLETLEDFPYGQYGIRIHDI
ncbi:MAG: hypothetical protein FRX48_08618 [Lasallia pustulata]|uniref:HAD superfamily hydrolase n=1 Tax=Lasallia pustulata TaxID=136370 RepID=A0A5M8PFV1_9LECA|nr:MAG: hypothetical protein FRX48_08618 [Lasallia pustulata]